MFLAKLCDVFDTDIDGLHDELMKIPGTTSSIKFRSERINDEIIYERNTEYVIFKNDVTYVLNILLADDYVANISSPQNGESKFLALFVKPIVRVKSARN
jgi:hypothetical protein